MVNYTGSLAESGQQFDSSLNPGRTPFVFQLGVGQVIQGWDLGLVGAQPGETRTITIPSSLGYGERGTPDGSIPANADLVFDVEVLRVFSPDTPEAEIMEYLNTFTPVAGE